MKCGPKRGRGGESKNAMNRALFIGLAFGWAVVCCAPVSAQDQDRRGLDLFEKKIRPVLIKHCYECHSSESRQVQGGFLLDTRVGVRNGGDSGSAVVPGSPDESLLLDALRFESFEMPPSGKLPDEVIADFKQWIALGAPDPREGDSAPVRRGIDFEEGRKFWAFQSLMRTDPPSVKRSDWPAGEIDRFVLAKMEAAGLTPAVPADRRTLIRRAYFDLIGLPPTAEAVAEFVNDDSPQAFAKVVDSLLASPHFGERWGRHWLDVARFAESSGGGRELLYREAWRYRDYVIDAFNRDKPFDRFLTEQIAGDLLPYDTPAQGGEQLTATAFLVLGPHNYELQDKERLRMDVVDEQIDTLGRAFLGMTIGCARCHDHKFDPISHADYHALAGIFRSTKTLTPGNVSGYVQTALPVDEDHQAALKRHEAQVKPLQQELDKATSDLKSLQEQLGGKPGRVAPSSLAGVVVDDADAQPTGDWKSSGSVLGYVGSGYSHAGRGDSQMRYELPLSQSGRYEVRVSHSANPNRAGNAPFTIEHVGGATTKRVNQRQPPTIDGLFVSLGTFEFSADRPAVIVVSCKDADGVVIADAVQLLPVDKGEANGKLQTVEEKEAEEQRKAKLQSAIAEVEAQAKELTGQIQQLQKEAPPASPLVMSVRDEDETGDYCICIRGNVHNLGQEVPRGGLTVIDFDSRFAISEGRSGRLELTEWMVDRNNPLTARVAVNRIWHHLFGTGLVRTVDNFGKTGETPSHPELLDWLALRYMDDGWSTKAMIRQIMLSNVYQLSSRADGRAKSVDPENRLLSHANRRRLEAEALHDAILFVSGRLDIQMGGPTIRPNTRSELGYNFDGNRRAVYIPVFRNALHEIFEVFDFADPNLVMGGRNTTTLPTQALFLMNSPLVMDQAEHAARRLLDELPDADDRQRLETAYRSALGRPPTPSEEELAVQYLTRFTAAGGDSIEQQQVEAWAMVFQTLFACLDFRYVD
jgi:hypothetical protein